MSELWHMAGLSPNLTEAEVFDSLSDGAFVRRFLVGYVICVREESRLLYSDRLQVYGKDRSYTTERFHDLLSDFKAVCDEHAEDPVWVRKCTAEGPFDVFEPELIRHALESEDINLGSLIFGADLWAALHANTGLPAACLSSDNVLANFILDSQALSSELQASWLNPSAYTYLFHANTNKRERHPLTILYRVSSTNIWSIIPAFPDNSAPIPQARPLKPKVPAVIVPSKSVSRRKASMPTKPKQIPILIPKPTLIQQCSSSIRERALLSYIIQHTQDFTVGPLDYCGIARRIKGWGTDV
ncbi:hypothetical protein B0H13DRAFT_2375020 [Mycena leptocephala]|nr:hypothetical protein B0H13DRAFT_2375020 [Mycena leptocephala]